MLPPWKKPVYLVWFLIALAFSASLMSHMPESRRSATVKAEHNTSAAEQHVHTPGSTQEQPQSTTVPIIKAAESSLWEKFLKKLRSFTRLFTMVGIAAFLGAVIELRCWHRFLATFMGRLTQVARLPALVGLAMPTALVSSAAANTMLVTSHAEGHIRTSALIAGGMANSYLSYISHSLRIIIPVVLTIGIPGIAFFSVQLSGGFLVIVTVFIWNRWRADRDVSYQSPSEQMDLSQHMRFAITPWNSTIRKATTRAFSLLFRLVCITVPLMLGIEWLLKVGAFDFWNELAPAGIHRFFPAEAISIVATQLGGLIQSSAVAANLRAEGLITNAQILLAMLAASAVGNPIRSIRRNLATSLAIFPPNVACIVVFTMQFSRMLVALLGVCATVFYIHNL